MSKQDIAEINEFIHLRTTLGDFVWPGFGKIKIPLILYNEKYVFLTGLKKPAAGWIKIPQMKPLGSKWEKIHGDKILRLPYYRQQLDSNNSPGAFIVLVGTNWTASMTTLNWTKTKLEKEIRKRSPSFAKDTALLKKIIAIMGGNMDMHICLMMHEGFHVFQAIENPERIIEAERIMKIYDKYPWKDTAHNRAWKDEFVKLIKAVESGSMEQAVQLAREFVLSREQRYLLNHFDSTLIKFERLKEWEEGLAKYIELAVWKKAAFAADYHPNQQLLEYPDFTRYKDFDRRWAQEKMTMNNQPQDDDVRFYYSGMMLAFLLDRLYPDWKSKALTGRLFPDELLAEAVK